MAFHYALHGTRANLVVQESAAAKAAAKARYKAGVKKLAKDTIDIVLDDSSQSATTAMHKDFERKLRRSKASGIVGDVLEVVTRKEVDRLNVLGAEAAERDMLRHAIEVAARKSADDRREQLRRKEEREREVRDKARRAARNYEESIRAAEVAAKASRRKAKSEAEAKYRQKKTREAQAVDTLLAWNREPVRLSGRSPFLSPGAKLGSLWGSMSLEERKKFSSSARKLGL